MVHGAKTLQVSCLRLLLALASMNSFSMRTSDVKLACLQFTKPLERRVFIRDPAPEFELDPSECFELQLPLYGFCHVGMNHWTKTWLRTCNFSRTKQILRYVSQSRIASLLGFTGHMLTTSFALVMKNSDSGVNWRTSALWQLEMKKSKQPFLDCTLQSSTAGHQWMNRFTWNNLKNSTLHHCLPISVACAWNLLS